MTTRFLTKLILAIAFLTVFPSHAQDAMEVSPDAYTVLFENDEIRVLEMTYQPGKGDQVHSHPKYVAMVMEGGNLRVHHNGESEDVEFRTGEIVPLEPVHQHWAENIGDKVFRGILIEYKQ
jgi:quercetin dioxygenase-like cupin family protein